MIQKLKCNYCDLEVPVCKLNMTFSMSSLRTKRGTYSDFHVVPWWLVRISKSILIQLNGGTAFHQALLSTTLRALSWSSLRMNVKQKRLMGNKCGDENRRHCCVPLSITAQTRQTLLQLSLVVRRTRLKLTFAFMLTSAELVTYQIPACLKLY